LNEFKILFSNLILVLINIKEIVFSVNEESPYDIKKYLYDTALLQINDIEQIFRDLITLSSLRYFHKVTECMNLDNSGI